MENNQSSYASWTWIIAFLLALILFWMFLTGKGPSSACCSDADVTAVTEPASDKLAAVEKPAVIENFSFSATDSDFTSDGDASNISWIHDSEALKVILSTGIIAEGDDALVVLSGSVESEEAKTQKGLEAQTFFGPDVTVDNQIVVIEPEPILGNVAPIAEIAVPSDAKIYFGSGVHRLPTEGPTTLAPIITWLNDNPDTKAVISGFHDPTGDYASNQRLAKKRAESVFNAITSEGIDATRLEMRKPEVTEGGGSLAEARRVEVSVE